jgi:hypothetical protein
MTSKVYPAEWFKGLPIDELDGNYWIDLPNLKKLTELSPEMLRKEFIAGRLVAHGEKLPNGQFAEILVKVSDVAWWMAKGESRAARRAFRNANKRAEIVAKK